MRGNVYQTPIAGGLETRLPQNPQNAGKVENWISDRSTGGWSSRLGYEPFRPGATNWDPFGNNGPIYSLHVAQHLAGGARQHVLFEEGGSLHLLYDAAGTPVLRTLATGRHIPTATEAGSWYTDTGYGTVVTNGFDRPVIVKPWPLGSIVDSSSTITQCIRNFGFDGLPTSVDPHNVKPIPPPPFPPDIPAPGAGAVTLWCPSQGNAVPDGGRWGLGFADNAAGTDGAKEAIFAWSVSFISDTGSEGPTSPLASVRWALEAGAEGFKHAAYVDLPTGPKGTVARKLYRTANYSDDFDFPGDTTLYFIDIIRNNVETVYFDAVSSANLGQPAPAIATGPLPAPRARFSALYNGCLFLDGGIDDSRTLYFSTAGLIEQFSADAYIELSSIGGGITALFSNYTSLLVFRENGIDVVQGDYTAGFTVTTISNSVTCKAPHSIKTVPGLGVVFLATDGVYAITGGLVGGANAEVINLTSNQDSFIDKITPDCMPKAVAVFSEKSREYQLYVPLNGNDRPDRGLVLHVDRLGSVDTVSPWSTRLGFPVGAVSSFYDGTVVFGHHTGNEDSTPNSQRGLFVISGKHVLGKIAAENTLVYAPPPVSTYRSAWNAFGDPQTQKQVNYVTLWIITTGNVPITVRHYKDFSLTATEERTYLAQPPDATSLPVLDKAVIGAANFSDERLIPLRVSVAHQSAAWFCFEIETQAEITLVGYEYDYITKGTRVVAGVRA